MKTVSVLIPCLNESKFIDRCLASVLAFEIPPDFELLEILVIDGGSTDGTLEIVAGLAKKDSRIRVVDNPRRIQSTGMNKALEQARGDYIVRLDAHSLYGREYLALLIETSVRTGCDNVGGLFITQRRDDQYQSSLVQALTTHKFGVGNSGFRLGAQEGPADTVPYGFFPRALFARIGLFDERLVRAQDYELNRRIISSGGCVWRNPNIHVAYYPPATLQSFLRKQVVLEAPYNAYLWYVAPYAFAVRHAITGFFAAGVIAGILLSPFSRTVRLAFGLVMGLYAILAILSAIQQAIRYREPRHVFTLPIAFFLYHFLHGLGLIAGVFRLLIGTAPVKKSPEPWRGAGQFRAWPPLQKSG
jgi:glycosyltransferase involved in cell wall biosynthesis